MSLKAVSFNKAAIATMSLKSALPSAWLEAHGLSADFTAEQLVKAAADTQRALNLKVDGMLGGATLKAIIEKYGEAHPQYWVDNTTRLKSELPDGTLISYEQQGGLSLHEWGHFTPRWFQSRQPRRLVVHWGGFDPVNLHSVFCSPRKVSSHAGLGLVGGEARVYQYINFVHKAWHAGAANADALGIDICQSPDVAHERMYLEKGYGVRVMQNTTGRGPSKCLSLDPRITELAGLVIRDICKAKGIPLRRPDDHGIVSADFEGVVGHHHVVNTKWDIAPWFDEVFEVAAQSALV